MAGAGATATAHANAKNTAYIAHASGSSEEEEVLTRLRSILASQGFTTDSSIQLTIKDVGANKIYTTKFTNAIAEDSNAILFGDGCINLNIWEDGYVSTLIRANTDTPACFEPRLESNSTTKTTDVLQVLKTKLSMIHPLIQHKGHIELVDMANIKGVSLTEFRLLRGDAPFYQKYGYFSKAKDAIDSFRTQMVKLTVGDVRSILMPRTGYYPLKEQFATLFSKEGDDSMSFTDMLKERVPMTAEMRGQPYHEFSSNLYSVLIKYYMKWEIVTEDIMNEYTFNPDSEEWKGWKQKILITDAKVLAKGGRRRRGRKTQRKGITTRSRSKKNRSKKVFH